MSARGLFITVEGGEGVGKSTNMAFIEENLRNHGVDLLVTREPGGTRLGEQLRELLLELREEEVAPDARIARRIELEPALITDFVCDMFGRAGCHCRQAKGDLFAHSKAGKHVFAEKPMAVDAPGARKVLAAGEEAK